MKRVLIFRHIAREPVSTIDGVLRGAGLDVEYVDLFDGQAHDFDPQTSAGLVVLGGPMNVDEADQFPFLAREIGWLASAIDCRLPTLGICLGAQLLAAALGARVWHSPRREIGWFQVELNDAARSDRLLRHYPEPRPMIFQWHGDTFDLPRGAVHLASSPVCENQAFRYGDNAWAIQFHPEVTAEIIETWLTEPGGCREMAELAEIDPQVIRDDNTRHLAPMYRVSARVFQEFAAVCHERTNAT